MRNEDRDGLVVSTYIHDEDSSGVELLNNPFGRNTDRGHEESGLLLYGRTRRRVLSAQNLCMAERSDPLR